MEGHASWRNWMRGEHVVPAQDPFDFVQSGRAFDKLSASDDADDRGFIDRREARDEFLEITRLLAIEHVEHGHVRCPAVVAAESRINLVEQSKFARGVAGYAENEMNAGAWHRHSRRAQR